MHIKVEKFVDHPDRVIEGVTVTVQEVFWSDGVRSWEVSHKGTKKSLTGPDFELEEEPTDDQIFNRLKELVGFWICNGCGKSYRHREEDMIYRHTIECDLWYFQVKLKRNGLR